MPCERGFGFGRGFRKWVTPYAAQDGATIPYYDYGDFPRRMNYTAVDR